MSENGNKMAKALFGGSEYQDKLAAVTATAIVSDMLTLYAEFRKAIGPGALFFNPNLPDNSGYLTTEDIYKDMVQAEENLDSAVADTLKKLISVIEKNEKTQDAIVVTIDSNTLSVHVINPESAKEQLEKIRDEAKNL